LEGINLGEADAEMEPEPDTTGRGGGSNDEKEAAWWRDTLPVRVLESSGCPERKGALPDAVVVNGRLRISAVTGAERPAGGGERMRATPTVD